jgi:hypothetical protein
MLVVDPQHLEDWGRNVAVECRNIRHKQSLTKSVMDEKKKSAGMFAGYWSAPELTSEDI